MKCCLAVYVRGYSRDGFQANSAMVSNFKTNSLRWCEKPKETPTFSRGTANFSFAPNRQSFSQLTYGIYEMRPMEAFLNLSVHLPSLPLLQNNKFILYFKFHLQVSPNVRLFRIDLLNSIRFEKGTEEFVDGSVTVHLVVVQTVI